MSTKNFKGEVPVTRLCTHTLTSLQYRNANLVEDLIGKKSFTEVMLMLILGRPVRAVDVRVTDAAMVAIMEHGLTPSAIATRLVYMSAPENLQGAVAAGLLAVGSQFVGTMENCSKLIDRIESAGDPRTEAVEIALDFKQRRAALPGFGHHLHKPVDPRAYKLLDLARAEPELAGTKIQSLETLSEAIDEVYGRKITVNATGAVAATLGELGISTNALRGFAVVARAGGLVAHVVEEQQSPSGRYIWEIVEKNISFVDDARAEGAA